MPIVGLGSGGTLTENDYLQNAIDLYKRICKVHGLEIGTFLGSIEGLDESLFSTSRTNIIDSDQV